MRSVLKRGRVVLIASVLIAPVSWAQEALPAAAAATAVAAADAPLVDIPGGEIVVLGTRDIGIQQATTQVVSVLSREDISRTGEGDIAGALGRVTGLSVVGGGFVYVRGLGDRYSQALLNGLQLPSPEPLRRAIPLDLFPTDVIASSLVQKTYSANFPGEFGGGVINLTTIAVPKTPFLKVSMGVSGDTETTAHLGYDHYGSRNDWTGYDLGFRDTPPALQAFLASGQRLSSGAVDSTTIASQFVNTRNGLVQGIGSIPANGSVSASGGTSWIFNDQSQLGFIATAGYSNKWRTRDNLQQTPASFDLSAVDKDYRAVASENRIVGNALVGLAYEFGEANRIRWTNLYVHDTLKRTSLAQGKQNNQHFGQDFIEQGTGWYERQLVDTQLNGSLKFEPMTLDFRASYAKSKREAPYELDIGYSRSNQSASPYGAYFINRLDNGQTGFARVAFSDLDETLKSVGADVTARLTDYARLTVGADFSNMERESRRREFQILAPSILPTAVAMFRPDYLLGPSVLQYYRIGLIETTESDPAFAAELRTRAGYAQLQAQITPTLEVSGGARYETGQQDVRPIQVFSTSTSSGASTSLHRNYLLPSLTLTYKLPSEMQVRISASKTIARPQFRELMFQAYFDPESNRSYRGNPQLVDSEFVNGEARYEWYFAPEQRFSVAGFYKRIDRPIEAFTGFNDNTPVTSFANAPRATLYGAETEFQRHFPLDRFRASFLASRRAVLIGNYTYSRSRLAVQPADAVAVFGTSVQSASNFFKDGAPLTGQSDHLVNLQFGLERTGRLSQQTLLLAYSSDRVTSRGPAGLPDIYESPGLTVDFVAREGITLFGHSIELKLEGRNLTGHGYSEFQERNGNRVYYNKYRVGTSYSASLSASF